jgi:hypothetical protein
MSPGGRVVLLAFHSSTSRSRPSGGAPRSRCQSAWPATKPDGEVGAGGAAPSYGAKGQPSTVPSAPHGCPLSIHSSSQRSTGLSGDRVPADANLCGVIALDLDGKHRTDDGRLLADGVALVLHDRRCQSGDGDLQPDVRALPTHGRISRVSPDHERLCRYRVLQLWLLEPVLFPKAERRHGLDRATNWVSWHWRESAHGFRNDGRVRSCEGDASRGCYRIGLVRRCGYPFLNR